MSEADTQQGQTSGSTMVKPNATITERHDRLLDNLADSRYATRSEALRAAIESLNESVEDNGKTITEQLVSRVEQLNAQLQELEDQLEEIQNHLTAGVGPSYPGSTSPHSEADQIAAAVDTSGLEPDTAELVDDTYAVLTEASEMTEAELAETLDTTPLRIRNALSELVDIGFVACTDHEDTRKYRTTDESSN